jgi:hypothetical protein
MIDGMLANCCWIWMMMAMAMDIHDGFLLVHLHLLVLLLHWLLLEI